MTTLTQRLDRQPTWLLGLRLMKYQADAALKRFARRSGLRRSAELSDDDLVLPDSALARRALELVTEVSPDFLLNHGLRSFAFGVALGRRDGLRFDRELLFLATVMHDLGLTTRFDGPEAFELQGARAARSFLLEEGAEARRADLVHEAIALHASIGVASLGAPEVALCHHGVGVDVAGLRLHDFEQHDVARVVATWPRHAFKRRFVPLLIDQTHRKPDCNIAGLVGLGFMTMIEKAPYSE
jgi:hypothetical protein